MKYGIFSDVHANLEAFEEVLKTLEEEKVDAYVFLGDIVGYGASPQECIGLLQKLMKEKGCTSIAGNHDYAVCGATDTENYNYYAKVSIDWTKKELNDSQKEFLSQLQLVQHVNGFTAVHANLVEPQDWGYIFDIDDAYPNFKILEDQVCFIGHSHRPIVFTAGEIVDWSLENHIPLQKDTKYIINIGSVGQPRDGNPKAAFAIYDTDSGLVEIKRVTYDIKKAQKKIIDSGLPHVLADRLSKGK